MDVDHLISQMADNAQRLRALAEGASDHQARWKPDPASWSILEVVNHLLDEERQDFRVRLDLALYQPDQPWPGIDPEVLVQEQLGPFVTALPVNHHSKREVIPQQVRGLGDTTPLQ